MRRLSVLLVLLLVIVFPTTAYAIDHWGASPSGPTPGIPPATAALAAQLILMLILAWFLTVVFPGTNFRCAFFVAVGSVSAMHLFVEFAFLVGLNQWTALTPGQVAFAFLLQIALLWIMVVWGAGCCLGRAGRRLDALKVAVVGAVLAELFPWLIRLMGFRPPK